MYRNLAILLAVCATLLTTACGGGGSSGAPAPTVTVLVSPIRASISVAGNQQFTATVLDASDSSVRWTASSGTIDASGFFTAPPWPGDVTITATSVADPRRSATASATIVPQSSADVQLSIITAGATGNTLSISAAVASRNPLRSVTAYAGSSSVALALSADRWTGSMSVTDLRVGTHWLRVAAVDAQGSWSEAFVQFVVDRPPTITVSTPMPDLAVGTATPFAASCADDVSCSISVRINDLPPTTYGASAKGELLLGAFDGREVNVTFTATDGAGQQASVTRHLYVESSPRLRRIGDYPGIVRDVRGDAVLYFEPDQEQGGYAMAGRLMLRGGAAEPQVVAVARQGLPMAALTPDGVVFAVIDDHLMGVLAVWKDGVSNQLATAGGYTFTAAGHWVGWVDANGSIFRKDIRDLTEVSAPGNGSSATLTLAENGDVVFFRSSEIWRLSDSGVARLGDPAAAYENPVVTDGMNVVATRRNGNGDLSFVLATTGGDTELARTTTYAFSGGPPPYAVNGGWVAFLSPPTWGPTQQVSIRSPQESIVATAQVPSDPYAGLGWPMNGVQAVGTDGTAIVYSTRRYRVRTDGSLEDVGGRMGQAMFRDGRYLVVLGRSVFEIVP